MLVKVSITNKVRPLSSLLAIGNSLFLSVQ